MRLSFSILLCLFIALPLAAQHESLKISKLTENVYVYTTWQEYQGARISANGIYLVTQEGVFLIDTPWDSTQFQPLLDSIEAKHETQVVACISTHFHDDRTGGLTYYRKKGIRTYTTQYTDQFSIERNKPRAQFLMLHDTAFRLGNQFVQTFYPGKGHTADNIVIWLPQEKVLYGGCFIKSIEATDLGNLEDASVASWMSSAERVIRQFPHPRFIIPGHQDWNHANALEHTLDLIREHQRKKAIK